MRIVSGDGPLSIGLRLVFRLAARGRVSVHIYRYARIFGGRKNFLPLSGLILAFTYRAVPEGAKESCSMKVTYSRSLSSRELDGAREIEPQGPHGRFSVSAEWPAADILGLESEETDPVAIISNAHLRLRQYRRWENLSERRMAATEMRRIVQARDELLKQAVSRLAVRVAGTGLTPSR